MCLAWYNKMSRNRGYPFRGSLSSVLETDVITLTLAVEMPPKEWDFLVKLLGKICLARGFRFRMVHFDHHVSLQILSSQEQPNQTFFRAWMQDFSQGGTQIQKLGLGPSPFSPQTPCLGGQTANIKCLELHLSNAQNCI